MSRMAACTVETRKYALSTVQKLLVDHGGPLLQFEPADTNRDNSTVKQRALAKFASPADAAKAIAFSERNTQLNELGKSRLFLQRIFTLKYSAPSLIVHAIKSEIEAALNDTNHGSKVRYSFFSGSMSGNTAITIHADEEAALHAVRGRLDTILSGQVVRDIKHRVLWNRYVSSKRFRDDLLRQVGGDVIYMWLDKRRQEIRLFGKNGKHKDHLAAEIQKLCHEAEIETHAMPITQSDFQMVLFEGRRILDQVMRGTGCRKVSLDIRNRSLLVEGTPEAAVQAKAVLTKLLHNTEDDADNGELCPICFCPPAGGDADEGGAAARLQCNHAFCRDCFETWLTGSNLCAFPLVCLSEDCQAQVSLGDLKTHLSFEAFSGLMRRAVDDHVRKTESIQFCILPTCPGLRIVEKGERFSSCSTCLQKICNDCQAMHGNLSCKDYQLASLPPNRLRMKIVDDILTLRCPRCNQAFLDFDGCFALCCNVCPCRFCGWCLKDCGDRDAHPHVAICPQKVGRDKYFGTREEFERAQNKKRAQDLRVFLSTFTPDERSSVLNSVSQELMDLGMRVDAFK